MTTDLDARRDVVASLLAEPYRQSFLAPRPGRDRRAEVLDLAGVSRDHVIDVVCAGLTPSQLCDPYLMTFAPDSFWRGETHRLCDRPGSLERLLEEVAEAGATQVIVVTAVAPAAAPHRLRAPRLDLAGRFGEFQAAAESCALRDALEAVGPRFDSVYVIQPTHNAIGPFDLSGAYDEASARRQDLSELMERAYEDAYRQFIEPVIGASGEQLAHAGVGVRESGGADDFTSADVGVTLIECDRTRSAEILAILNEAITNSTALYDYKPRTMAMMDTWFDAKFKGNYPVIGAVDETGRLFGFASYGMFRERPAYKYTVEHSVYVDSECRGRGVGRLLLEALIERARAQNYHVLIGGIDGDNAVSIEMHRKFGFTFCGEIREAGFKFGRWLHLHFYQLILDYAGRTSRWGLGARL